MSDKFLADLTCSYSWHAVLGHFRWQLLFYSKNCKISIQIINSVFILDSFIRLTSKYFLKMHSTCSYNIRKKGQCELQNNSSQIITVYESVNTDSISNHNRFCSYLNMALYFKNKARVDWIHVLYRIWIISKFLFVLVILFFVFQIYAKEIEDW